MERILLEDIQGVIFNFVTGSFVDGYGVRTTVFLKGCPLRCIWCCDPEAHNVCPELKVDRSKCNVCGRCISICPVKALYIDSWSKKLYVNRKLCTNCGKCVDTCYNEALGIFGKYVTVKELFEVIKRGEEYFRDSGGGVTLGGGEPTFQSVFAFLLLKKCKENHINVALDTCGYTTSELGRKLLEEADLLLYDVKHMDPKKHLMYTGVSNELILKNLRELNKIKKPIIIRIPIVPGYNDDEENIRSTADFLSRLKSVKRVDLLPYHEYGKIKYEYLDREYCCQAKPPSEEHMKNIRKIFEEFGLTVQIGG